MTPIILHHGLLVPGNVSVAGRRIGSFMSIERILVERGHPTVVTQVHPTASIIKRAAQLKHFILEHLRLISPHKRVVIFAHSMGGLDARYMITHLGMAERVAALITLSTPHHGSPYADWCLRHLGRFRALQLFNALGLDTGAATDLTIDACARLNERTPDAPGVRYFSVSAARPFWKLSPLLYQPYRIVQALEGENDGLVSVRSARWGRHVETWPADHIHMLNLRLKLAPSPDNIQPYYIGLLDWLAQQGVIEPPRDGETSHTPRRKSRVRPQDQQALQEDADASREIGPSTTS